MLAFFICLAYRSAVAVTATTTALALSSANQSSGTALTLTATVLAGAAQVHPGTVTFCDASAPTCRDGAILGRAQLMSNGTAAYKFIPGIGTHSYKAIFTATATYSSSSSTASSVTVTGLYGSQVSLGVTGSAGNYTLQGTTQTFAPIGAVPTGTVSFLDTSNANYNLGSIAIGSTAITQAFPNQHTGNPVPNSARYSVAADFNGDGIPDVAVVSQTSGVYVYLGNGDGTFTAATGSPVATGATTTVGIAAGDFNGDGKIDLLATSYGGSRIVLMLGNGDGTFQSHVNFTTVSNPVYIAVGDMNGDGNLDAVVACTNQVTILFGNGSGGFPTTASYSVGSGPYSVVIADFDSDGSLDFATGNSSTTTVSVYLNNGSGTFTQASGSPVTVGLNPKGLAAADFNNDGKVDLITSDSGDNYIDLLLGNGNGTFATAIAINVNMGNKLIVAGDWNNDGNPDVAVASTGGLYTLLGNGNGTFQTPVLSTVTAGTISGIAVADYNGDGLPDIELSQQGDSTSTIYTNVISHNSAVSVSGVSVPGTGTHTLKATYSGDTQNTSSISAGSPVTATPIGTNLTLSATPANSSYGQQVVLTSLLSPYAVGSLTTNTEPVTFYSGGTPLGTANLSNGVASLNVTSLTPGTDSLTAKYTTDANFLTSTSATLSYTVTRGVPMITWPAPSPIAYGTALSATQLDATSSGVPGTFVYTPASGTVLNSGAGQTLSVLFTPTDTANYNSTPASTSISVDKASPTVSLASSASTSPYAASVTLTATVPTGADGVVTFLDGGVSIGTGNISGNTAIFTPPNFSVGSHSLSASWRGNANFLSGVSGTLTQVVTRTAAAVTEISSRNPSLYGDEVVFFITLSGAGVTPTGTVTLKDGAISLTTLALDASGNATYTANLLSAGSHKITATYNGDTNYF